MTLSMHSSDWKLLGRNGQSGKPLLFRSRTHVPEVREFAEQNAMGRVRCVIAESELNDAGMPRSADDLNAFEDSLVGALEAANAGVYLIALVTGEGHRDLFFAARDLDDLRAGIKAADNAPTISLQFAPVGDDAKASFLKMLTLTPEMEQSAAAAGRVHGVEVKSGGKSGGLIAKLFGREREV
jgi:hypothetical protein